MRASSEMIRSGRLVRLSALRLMLGMGVAAVTSEVLPLARSYWVLLTVAIVLKPDFGSVFARALQRGIGTIIGAVLGAVLLAVVPHGPLVLIPLAVLAFGMPYGMSRNYGLFATLLTPLVVLLIDLLAPGGWVLAEVRLLDTVLGCAIVLLLGYAPWPSSWHADVGTQLAGAVDGVASYLQRAFSESDPADADVVARSQARRLAYRRLSDLRTTFQRALAEPPAISRRVTRCYPAVVGLERTLDAVTATAAATRTGAPAPTTAAVHEMVDALDEIGRAVRNAEAPRRRELPTEAAARPIADPIRGVQGLFAPDGHPSS